MSLASLGFSAAWRRFFADTAERARQAPRFQQPAWQAVPVPSREALEIGWLLRCLPSAYQAALGPDLLALKRSRRVIGALPVADYTWPDVSGVRRPRYPTRALRMKTVERLCARLRGELRLGVTALCAPERDLSRPMRNALLAMQGRRLGQLAETLAGQLEPEVLLALLRQELATLRPEGGSPGR